MEKLFTAPGPVSAGYHCDGQPLTGFSLAHVQCLNCGPPRFLDAKSFDNAIVADMAVGGSTNALIHLVAMAGLAASRSRKGMMYPGWGGLMSSRAARRGWRISDRPGVS